MFDARRSTLTGTTCGVSFLEVLAPWRVGVFAMEGREMAIQIVLASEGLLVASFDSARVRADIQMSIVVGLQIVLPLAC